MKIKYHPQVYLIGYQQINRNGLNNFLSNEDCSEFKSDAPSPGEELIEISARLCYSSYKKPRPGGNKAYIDNIVSSQHGSVVEGAVFSFIIIGISRSLSHELIRTRVGMSPSQRSQRYVDEQDSYFIEPKDIAEDTECHKIWEESIVNSEKAYKELSKLLYEKYLKEAISKNYNIETTKKIETSLRKKALEKARSVLPNATETKIFLTWNVRSIRNFIEIRGSKYADEEIRVLAFTLLDIMKKEAPNLFADYTIIKDESGIPEIITKNRKI